MPPFDEVRVFLDVYVYLIVWCACRFLRLVDMILQDALKTLVLETVVRVQYIPHFISVPMSDMMMYVYRSCWFTP